MTKEYSDARRAFLKSVRSGSRGGRVSPDGNQSHQRRQTRNPLPPQAEPRL